MSYRPKDLQEMEMLRRGDKVYDPETGRRVLVVGKIFETETHTCCGCKTEMGGFTGLGNSADNVPLGSMLLCAKCGVISAYEGPGQVTRPISESERAEMLKDDPELLKIVEKLSKEAPEWLTQAKREAIYLNWRNN